MQRHREHMAAVALLAVACGQARPGVQTLPPAPDAAADPSGAGVGPVEAQVEACSFAPIEPAPGPECAAGPIEDLATEAGLEPWAGKVVAGQVKALGSGDPAARKTAARVLRSAGPAAADTAEPALSKALGDEDAGVRARAAAALWEMGRQRSLVLPVAAEVATGGDPEDAMAAIDVFGMAGPLACGQVGLLVSLLDDEPEALRARAAAALASMGPSAWEAIPALVRMLEDPVPWVAGQASASLGEIGGLAAPALVGVLAAGSANARRGALAALAGMDRIPVAALPALECAAGDAEPVARRIAILSIGRMVTEDDADMIPLLVEALGGEDAGVSGAAREAILAIGPSTVPALVEMVARGSEGEARAATWTLVAMEAGAMSAIPDMIEIASGGFEQHQREAAVLVLQELGPGSDPGSIEDIVAALAAAAGDQGWDGRWRAAVALGRFGEDAVPSLVTLLGDGDATVRRFSAEALGAMGEEAAQAVPALVELLAAPDWQSRDGAAVALGGIGPAAAEAAPLLVEGLGKEPDALAWSEARALGGIRAPGSIDAILEGFESAEPGHGEFYPAALGFMGPDAAPAVDALALMLEDASPEVRSRAAWALGEIGPAASGGAGALAAAVKDDYMGWNMEAIVALGRIGPAAKKALPALIESMGQVGWSEVRVESMRATVSMGVEPGKVLPALLDALHDVNPDVKVAACIAIASHGKAAKKAVPDRAEALDDPDLASSGAWAPIEALGAIGPAAKKAAPGVIEHLYYLSTREVAEEAL